MNKWWRLVGGAGVLEIGGWKGILRVEGSIWMVEFGAWRVEYECWKVEGGI